MEKGREKRLFLISVIDEEGSLNRRYMESILGLLNDSSQFRNEYVIEVHNESVHNDLYQSLEEAIKGNVYEGYVIVLDCLDTNKGLCNPNVMFEFGAIKNLERPFVVIASHKATEFPFDVRNVNINYIPNCLIEYIYDLNSGNIQQDVLSWYADLHGKKKEDINKFFVRSYKAYCESRDQLIHKKEYSDTINENLINLINSHQDLRNEIKQITKYVSNTAEYIDGEAAAFSALQEAVSKAKYSLRSSRFANQSIVQEPTREQKAFMESLYHVSENLKQDFVRIICNNNPTKWLDIYNILFNGGNGSRVYVRKADFSIHFELVVIDEKIAFVHFYQQDHYNDPRRKNSDVQVERINSTLKIQGSSICKKFANIFDRLHHRDFEAANPQEPSKTLLGISIDLQDREVTTSENIGYFVMSDSVSNNIAARHLKILEMFKNAFKEWKIDGKDKINMAVGISMLESNCEFAKQMKEQQKLSEEEYNMVLELYKVNEEAEEKG